MSPGDAQRQPRRGTKRIRIGVMSILLIALPVALVCAGASVGGDDSPAPTYERDIKPIFAKRCTVCHSARKRDDPEISGGLVLDSFEGVLAGTARHKVIVPGRSTASELVHRLADADEDQRMPLQDEPLPGPQQELVRRWIDAGAPRGVAMAAVRAPVRLATAGVRPGLLRRGPGLEVVLASDVQLAPKTLNSTRGGPLEIALPIGPLPAVTSLAFGGDNRLLAVGTYGEIVLWDLQEGHPAGAIPGIPGPVHALTFSRDGRRLVVGAGLPARSGVVQVYSVPDGTKIHEFNGHEDVVFAVALRRDGAQLASASFDQTVRLWNLGLDRPDGVFRGHSDFVYAVAYTPDGRTLLTGSKDRTIKRINARTLKEERTYSGHNQDVFTVAVHPDGARFVSAGNEPPIRWWTFQGDKPVAVRGGHTGPVHQLAFSGDGRLLISASGDQTVRLWDGKTGGSLRRLAGPTDWQYAIAISDDGQLAAAGGWDGLVRLWETDSGRLRVTLVQPPGADSLPSLGHSPAPIGWFAACPSGQVAGSPDLIHEARWRSGGVILPTEVARGVSARPESVARAMRGGSLPALSFPLSHPE